MNVFLVYSVPKFMLTNKIYLNTLDWSVEKKKNINVPQENVTIKSIRNGPYSNISKEYILTMLNYYFIYTNKI